MMTYTQSYPQIYPPCDAGRGVRVAGRNAGGVGAVPRVVPGGQKLSGVPLLDTGGIPIGAPLPPQEPPARAAKR